MAISNLVKQSNSSYRPFYSGFTSISTTEYSTRLSVSGKGILTSMTLHPNNNGVGGVRITIDGVVIVDDQIIPSSGDRLTPVFNFEFKSSLLIEVKQVNGGSRGTTVTYQLV